MVFNRPGRPNLYLAVPTRTGSVRRSTGTANKTIARMMARMLEEIGPSGRRDWEMLEAVVANRLTLGALFDAWRMNNVENLRARLADEDLTVHIPVWRAWLTDQVRPQSADRYVAHLRTLMPEGRAFLRSDFTGPAVTKWLASRTALVQKRRPSSKQSRRRENPPPRPVSGSSKRKYLAAVRSFAAYLRELGILTVNPARDVSAPRAAPPRCEFLDLQDATRVVEGAQAPYRAIFALAYGAGLEVSAILALVDADVSPQAREVRARGTKWWTRDRIARVADWAWPYVEAHLKTVLPGERLFRGIDRWKASNVHRERLRALGLPLLRLHDARHHFAVRWVRAGVPAELVARQLGHRDATMVLKVYGRFAPQRIERDRWEAIAAKMDEELAGECTNECTETEKALEPESPSAWEDDSRGGTRTLDPGIMSAVL